MYQYPPDEFCTPSDDVDTPSQIICPSQAPTTTSSSLESASGEYCGSPTTISPTQESGQPREDGANQDSSAGADALDLGGPRPAWGLGSSGVLGSGSAGDGSCHTIRFASWNLAGWHGSSAKLDLLKSIDADIIGLVETHLHIGNSLSTFQNLHGLDIIV